MSFSDSEKEFLKQVSASVVVPTNPDSPIQDVLEEVSDVDQRSHLFFDEKVKVYFVLDFPECTEETLQSHLARLELNVEAWAVAKVDLDNNHPLSSGLARDLIAVQPVTQIGDPVTVVKQNEENSNVSLLLVWEVLLTLVRPRLRLVEPSIEFVPNAIISPKDDTQDHDGYLEPFSTLEPNVLEPLQGFDRSEPAPYLSVSSLRKILPVQPKEDIRLHLAYTASDLINIYPAVIARLKYTRINTHMRLPTTIASLDIEIFPFVEINGSVDEVKLSLSTGRLECLTEGFLPMTCRSKDCITLLYKLHPDNSSTGAQKDTNIPTATSNIDVLSISLLATIQISDRTKATISMNWTTNVDFSQAVNPSFGPPSQPIQRTKRPSSLPFGSADPRTAPQSSISSLQPALPRAPGHNSRSNVLTTSFTAPAQPVKVGVPFSWQMLIVNKSTKPVHLAIIPLPRVQRATSAAQQYAKRHAPKASTGSVQTADRNSKLKHSADVDVARAVVDDNILYALQHSGAVLPDIDIVTLTAELRVGPLSPGQCYESQIQFIAFKPGAFTMDAIRVVDLIREAEEGVNAPGVLNDIRELPDVIVEKFEDRQNVQ